MVKIRDGGSSMENFAWWDRLSNLTEIPGSRRGIRWGEQDGGGGREVE